MVLQCSGVWQRDLSMAQQGHRGDRPVGQAAAQYHFFIYSNIFQTYLNLNWSKDGLLLLKSFQINYGCVDIEIGNKLPHCSFSNFMMEFELKIREPI
jgi:hypothetical protein